MKPPFTMKSLLDWGGEQAFRGAGRLCDQGMVLDAAWHPPMLEGSVLWSNRALKTAARVLPDGTLDNRCPCYTSRERGMVCEHVLAVGMTVVKRAADPLRESRHEEEERRAQRMEHIDESAYIQRIPANRSGGVAAGLRLTLPPDWLEQWRGGCATLRCELVHEGQAIPLDEAPRNVPFTFNKPDEALLFVLEDIQGGPAPGCMDLSPDDFLNVVRLRAGGAFEVEDGIPLPVRATPLATRLRMEIDGETGEILLFAQTDAPGMRPGEFPEHLVGLREGWVLANGELLPLAHVLPLPYHPVYRDTVPVARQDAIRFLRHELPTLARLVSVETDLSLDLFTIDPATPAFRLDVRGSPASLAATLHAVYGEVTLVAGRPDPRGEFSLPDPDDIMRYRVRDLDRERQALELLARGGFQGLVGDRLSDLVGSREVLNFLGRAMPLLRRHGWQVDLQGRVAPLMDSIEFATPVVRVDDTRTDGWLDVAFDFEDVSGASLTSAEIQRAIRMGESFVKRGERTILFDADAVESMNHVFDDCGSRGGEDAGHFLLPAVHGAFVKSSLDALDGVDIEARREWIDAAARQNRSLRMERAPLPADVAARLRPYQRDGVDWLYFLENNGFCGVLADEMGLGKTVQTLIWLQLPRCAPDAAGRPALVVCPTSLVDNWGAEAERFAPGLRVLPMSGAERHTLWDRIESGAVDLVVTSYALLRRDQDRYAACEFSVVVLDEAQHIKNRSTQNALAAKRLRACRRLVLTGTPMENSVADLWSIMDFLMPGYLGAADNFRQHYEAPISRGDDEGDQARIKLRRKLQPFLLRRLKIEVATDLPPKIERVDRCPLSPDQKIVYAELLAASQRKVSELVAQRGFNRCRMEILTALLRLRQASCHLDLLKLPGVKPERPSAKMEVFLELIDEAMDGGRRVLVFSQFVSMLRILRTELDARGVTYCYLDGSTEERGEEVKRFNTDRRIPLFLISLKAGGTGLNLTGADMVIHFDPWWNPAVENQATDRAHRIGQKRTVYSVKLIAEGTIEEKVLELQRKKQALIDATIESDEDAVRTLTWEDVAELLNL